MSPQLVTALRTDRQQDFADAALQQPGFRSLALRALDFAREGITSLDEVFRVSATLDEGVDV